MNQAPARSKKYLGLFVRVLIVMTVMAVVITALQKRSAPRFINEDVTAFTAIFAAPPAANSPATRAELDELLAIQSQRTPADIAAAQADRKTRISRFADALGLTPEKMDEMPALEHFADELESEIRPFIRAAKQRFRRLRPYEVEPRLSPCIDDVRGDQSYPSGHAAYGYTMAFMLIDMVPERREQIYQRAVRFARQRMVCGVHFASDLAAGREGAAWLTIRMQRAPNYRKESGAARRELRAALGLPEAVAAPADQVVPQARTGT